MIKFRLLGLATLLLVWTAQGRAQFAHAEHKQIVDWRWQAAACAGDEFGELDGA